MTTSASSMFRGAEEASLSPPRVGEIVDGKYRIVRWLGEGGMGLIFEAEHLRLEQLVAVKFMQPDALALPDARARFDREARASARMRGPHVVQVIDVDTDPFGRPYMVMELLRGRDLEAELQDRRRLPTAEAVAIVLQACEALAEAHAAGIVHRDLKPSNLFLSVERGRRVVKVLDFGISSSLRDVAPPDSSPISMGTPLYMSPEQVRSAEEIDGRSDLWALGVILFELLAGSPPFVGATTAAIPVILSGAPPSLRAFRPDVPEPLDRIIARALARSPSQRFASAEAFAAALLPFAAPATEHASHSTRLDDATATDASKQSEGPIPGHPRRNTEVLRTFLATMAIGMCVGAASLWSDGVVPPALRASYAAAGAAHPPGEDANAPASTGDFVPPAVGGGAPARDGPGRGLRAIAGRHATGTPAPPLIVRRRSPEPGRIVTAAAEPIAM